MDDVSNFLKSLLAEVPGDIACDTEGGIVQPEELREPKRCKFALEIGFSHTVALEALAAFRNNINDIANLDDLRPFEDSKWQNEIPSYIS